MAPPPFSIPSAQVRQRRANGQGHCSASPSPTALHFPQCISAAAAATNTREQRKWKIATTAGIDRLYTTSFNEATCWVRSAQTAYSTLFNRSLRGFCKAVVGSILDPIDLISGLTIQSRHFNQPCHSLTNVTRERLPLQPTGLSLHLWTIQAGSCV